MAVVNPKVCKVSTDTAMSGIRPNKIEGVEDYCYTISEMTRESVYHYKFLVVQFNQQICFGYYQSYRNRFAYIKLSGEFPEVIKVCEGEKEVKILQINMHGKNDAEYELIFDMKDLTMSIRYEDGKTIQVFEDIPDSIYPCFILHDDNEVKLTDFRITPSVLIQRSRIVKVKIENDGIVSFEKDLKDLYKNEYMKKVNDVIQYTVVDSSFKDRGKGKFNYVINEVMKEGIYHFYYETIIVGKDFISLGYISDKNNLSTASVLSVGEVKEIYEVIYDMIDSKMSIKNRNGEEKYSTSILTTPIYPYIKVKDSEVELIEYYKENDDYQAYNDISLYRNTNIYKMKEYKEYEIITKVNAPNTICGIYNYEKYYVKDLLEKINTDITPIKDIIKSRFMLNDNQKKYITKSGIIDLAVFLNCYGDENINLDIPNSFVKVVNNLDIVYHYKLKEDGSIVESGETKKYLEFRSADIGVFQFPMNEIYIRDNYYTMFEDIFKLIKVYKYVIVIGHPGIGKTSFIYVLLYFIKNLLKIEELIEEIEHFQQQLGDYTSELIEAETNEIETIMKSTNCNYDLSKLFHDSIVGYTYRRKYKDIYVIKGKRHGTPKEKEIYLFRDGYIFKISINVKDINHSIIIVDTINEKFGNDNKIISISSPDSNNYKNYRQGILDYKELYLDSLNDIEIKEWFKYCIGFNIRVDSDDFEKICKRYGNIPRHIYYNYLYEENYKGRDYWKYYIQLIESVIGTIGYKKFEKAYQDKINLKTYPLFNLIFKYKLIDKMDNSLGHSVLEPEKELIYVSNSVKNYVNCKFYPPKDELEYKQVEHIYNDSIIDKYIRKMALKQLIAYDLSIKKVKLNEDTNNRDDGDDEEYDESDNSNDIYPDLKLDYKKELSIYYHINASKLVYFILDEDNYFDLIMDKVFIKVLLDTELFEKDKIPEKIEKHMKESIRQYSGNRNGLFKYCIIKYKQPPIFIERFSVEASPPTPIIPTTPVEEDFDVYLGESDEKYLMRNCFDKMLNIICENNFKFPHQRNFLIFGNSGIGKRVLANILKKKLEEVQNTFEVYLDHRRGQSEHSDIISDNKPYIVVVDGPAVGEDDYADAKMVIMLANPSDEKCKTFQSKRCPLLMYIPPFTKEEVVKVVKLKVGKFKDSYETFTNYNSINDGIRVSVDGLKEIINSYLDNYEYYGGIIGNYYKINKIISQRK